jgi:hypothetical protein
MLDDMTYLRLFVSPYEPWDEYLKRLHSKRLGKAEVKKRIGFAVVNGAMGKIKPDTGPMWLQGGESFAQYNQQDWAKMYDDIKSTDDDIISLRRQLLSYPYHSPESLLKDSTLIWTFNKLHELWGMERKEAAEEMSVYGIGIINEFLKYNGMPNQRLIGRYHFTRALHAYIKNNSKDVIKMKTHELDSIIGV